MAGRVKATGVKAAETMAAAGSSARLVERSIDGPDGKSHKVLVNLAESPVSWLYARKRLSRRQFEAAEKVRCDWERAAMGARVTMAWDAAASPSRGRRGAGSISDGGTTQIAARERLHGALAAAGPDLSDILWRVACACEGLSAAEHALGWPVRAGKLVLGFALDRVADFYRIA